MKEWLCFCCIAGVWSITTSQNCDRIRRPTGLDALFETQNPKWVCEKNNTASHPGIYAALIDTEARIPLAVATVITKKQYDKAQQNPGRSNAKFRPSRTPPINSDEQANCEDYKDSSKRIACFEKSQYPGRLYTDMLWVKGITSEECTSKEYTENFKIRQDIVQGHLIADGFIFDKDEKKATYRYTNAVPQFAGFNGPSSWEGAEIDLLTHPESKYFRKTWAWNNCFGHESVNSDVDVELYVVVGSVPSKLRNRDDFDLSFNGINVHVEPRWMGRDGFGDDKTEAGIDFRTFKILNNGHRYRVNVPIAMWTGACCVVSQGENVKYTAHTGYAGLNVPGPEKGNKDERMRLPNIWTSDINQLLSNQGLFQFWNTEVNVRLFPRAECEIPGNYKALNLMCNGDNKKKNENECLTRELESLQPHDESADCEAESGKPSSRDLSRDRTEQQRDASREMTKAKKKKVPTATLR